MKLILFIVSLFISTNLYAWTTETATSVVSQDANITVTSVEATQVLQSNTLGLLYGETRLGGTVNYASTNSAGVLSTRNVAQQNVMLLGNNDYLAWLSDSGSTLTAGVSTDNTFTITTSLYSTQVKADNYKSSDGTDGLTASCASSSTVTVKNGLITACA